VDTFSINDGAANTDNRQVRLSTTAHDNPGGSGVASLLYIEYEFIQSIADWVPVAIGDWLAYDETRTDYLWALQPSAGVHYLQVWVADGAGNISLDTPSDEDDVIGLPSAPVEYRIYLPIILRNAGS